MVGSRWNEPGPQNAAINDATMVTRRGQQRWKTPLQHSRGWGASCQCSIEPVPENWSLRARSSVYACRTALGPMLDRGEHPLAEFGILFPKIRDNRQIVRSGIQFLIHEFPQKFPRAETYRARRRFCDPLAQSKRQGKRNGNFWAKS